MSLQLAYSRPFSQQPGAAEMSAPLPEHFDISQDKITKEN